MATLTFKGRRDPIEINNKDGERVKNLWKEYVVDKRNKVVEIGLLTTSLSEIKSVEMSFESNKGEKPIYSIGEIMEHNKTLDKYRDPDKKNDNGTNNLPTKAETKCLVDKGILKKENMVYEHEIGRFEEHQNKRNQFKDWERKKEYAEEKELEAHALKE